MDLTIHLTEAELREAAEDWTRTHKRKALKACGLIASMATTFESVCLSDEPGHGAHETSASVLVKFGEESGS